MLLGDDETERTTSEGDFWSDKLVVEIGTCLWYLKTKYFKRAWDDTDDDGDDPRLRRALSRLNKGMLALKESGIEVHDPVNERYPQGGEGTMRPIQFVPTPGLAFERVSETVSPIIYRQERLIQAGEVYVSVPKEEMVCDENSTLASAVTVAEEGSIGNAALDEVTSPGNGSRAANSEIFTGKLTE
jgi:hypothetical protein